MVETKEKKVRPSKKAILREIAETDTPRLKKGEFNLGSLERTNILENNDSFDIGSLERTNIRNLTEIARLCEIARG